MTTPSSQEPHRTLRYWDGVQGETSVNREESEDPIVSTYPSKARFLVCGTDPEPLSTPEGTRSRPDYGRGFGDSRDPTPPLSFPSVDHHTSPPSPRNTFRRRARVGDTEVPGPSQTLVGVSTTARDSRHSETCAPTRRATESDETGSDLGLKTSPTGTETSLVPRRTQVDDRRPSQDGSSVSPTTQRGWVQGRTPQTGLASGDPGTCQDVPKPTFLLRATESGPGILRRVRYVGSHGCFRPEVRDSKNLVDEPTDRSSEQS